MSTTAVRGSGGVSVFVPGEVASGVMVCEAVSLNAADASGGVQCAECQLVGHVVSVRLYPCPDPWRPDAKTGLLEVCWCCAFGEPGCPVRGLLARLRGEQAAGDDRDIPVEIWRAGRWV